jgi:hypothetical protein
MQSAYAEHFVRDMGCTPREWLGWLPEALGPHAWTLGAEEAQVQIGAGGLRLRWAELPPRLIALMRMPRLQVEFRFEGLSAGQRFAFMKRFDLYMQRGGG